MNTIGIIFSIIILFLVAITIWIALPLFLEQPKYKVLKSDDEFQIRFYNEFTIAKVNIQGNQKESLRNGFIPLVRYIGAKFRNGEKIKMTVPVMQIKNKKEEDWDVLFFMPSRYSLDSLPKPKNKIIKLDKIPERYVAVVKFIGKVSETVLEKNRVALLDWIRKMNYQPDGEIFYSFYNDPLTPGFLRKNEVAVTVLGFESS